MRTRSPSILDRLLTQDMSSKMGSAYPSSSEGDEDDSSSGEGEEPQFN